MPSSHRGLAAGLEKSTLQTSRFLAMPRVSSTPPCRTVPLRGVLPGRMPVELLSSVASRVPNWAPAGRAGAEQIIRSGLGSRYFTGKDVFYVGGSEGRGPQKSAAGRGGERGQTPNPRAAR
jgi:hypothetical protein